LEELAALIFRVDPEDGSSRFFQNVGIHVHYYVVHNPKDHSLNALLFYF
jgi:hypothetical protein